MNARILSFLLVATAACSVAAPDGAAADDALTVDSVCATLDYGHAIGAADYYRRFANDAEAAAYAGALVNEGKLAGVSGPDARFREISRDARLLGLVREVFEGFKLAFPRETNGLTAPPPIAIIETDIVNAFAVGPVSVASEAPPHDRSPYMFFIHTALLNAGNTDDELRGLFAHEIGHLILRTFLPEIQRRVRAIYKVAGSEDGVLGAEQDDDPGVAAHVETILALRSRVGGLPVLGLPVALDTAWYGKLLKGLLNAPAGAPDPCAGAREKVDALRTLQAEHLPRQAEGIFIPRPPTAEESERLERLSTELGNEIRSCLGPSAPVGSLLELAAVIHALPPEAATPTHPDHAKLLGLALDVEREIDTATPTASIADRMLRAEGPLRRRLVTTEADPYNPIDSIRVFDYEEDADDAAVRVMRAIGKDPLGNGRFLLSVMPAAERAACLADVAAGRPVPFGRFIDPHPGHCWRYYHATQVAKALSRCDTRAATAQRAPKGSGERSLLDRKPEEAIEKGYGRGRR
jgi:hypothetical protein